MLTKKQMTLHKTFYIQDLCFFAMLHVVPEKTHNVNGCAHCLSFSLDLKRKETLFLSPGSSGLSRNIDDCKLIYVITAKLRH